MMMTQSLFAMDATNAHIYPAIIFMTYPPVHNNLNIFVHTNANINNQVIFIARGVVSVDKR